MIISHTHKFVFVKTKKTAGTSIEIFLSKYCGRDDVVTGLLPEDEELRSKFSGRGPQNLSYPLRKLSLRQWVRFLRGRGLPKPYFNHVSASVIASREGEIWDQYFTFCFERNPWDKVVSWFNFKRARRPENDKYNLNDLIESDDLERVSDWKTYTINGKIAVDHVARFEDLHTEMEFICKRIGLRYARELPRAKTGFRSDRRPYWEVLTEAQAERIAAVFHNEIETFGYEFGPRAAAKSNLDIARTGG